MRRPWVRHILVLSLTGGAVFPLSAALGAPAIVSTPTVNVGIDRSDHSLAETASPTVTVGIARSAIGLAESTSPTVTVGIARSANDLAETASAAVTVGIDRLPPQSYAPSSATSATVTVGVAPSVFDGSDPQGAAFGTLTSEPFNLSATPGYTLTNALVHLTWTGSAVLSEYAALTPSDLKDQSGHVIAASSLQTNLNWEDSGNGRRAAFLYLTIPVPTDAVPGVYTGSVHVETSAGSRPVSVDAPVTLSIVLDKPNLVILIRGTRNSSDFSDKDHDNNDVPGLLESKLTQNGIPYVEYKNLNGGMDTTSDADADQILQDLKTNAGWFSQTFFGQVTPQTKVAIVAHSYGGLVARRLAQKNANGPLMDLRTILTLGAPLGGINGVDWEVRGSEVLKFLGDLTDDPVLTALGVLGSVQLPVEMAESHMQHYKAAYADVSHSQGNDTPPDYWLIGGTSNDDPVDRALGVREPDPKDSLVSTRSVVGKDPAWQRLHPLTPVEGNAYDQDHDADSSLAHTVRFFQLNHEHLVSDPYLVSSYILPILLGGRWQSVSSPAAGAIQTPSTASPLQANPVSAPVTLLTGAIGPGQMQDIAIPVDSVTELTISTLADAASGSVSLKGPDGSVYPGVIQDMVDGIRQTLFSIPGPSSGIWTATVSTLGSTDPAIFSVAGFSDLAFSSGSLSEAVPGSPITLQAALIPTVGATLVQVIALVVAPDNSVSTHALNDSGQNGDPTAGDGIYSLSLAAPTAPGDYQIHYIAQGTRNGLAFRREDVETLHVVSGSGSITALGPETDDTMPDNRVAKLNISVAVTVPEAGHYLLTADVLDSGGRKIATAGGETDDLPSGSQAMVLSVSGADLLASKTPGPYTVTHVVLAEWKAGSLPEPIAVSPLTFTTGTYSLASFDHPPTFAFVSPSEATVLSGGTLSILWNAADADDPSATISLFLDNDGAGFDGKLIADKLPLNGSYSLSADSLASGTYYLYAIADDGVNPPVKVYAPGAITVSAGETLAAKLVPATITTATSQRQMLTVDLAHSVDASRIASVTLSITTADTSQIVTSITIQPGPKTIALWDAGTGMWLEGAAGSGGSLTGQVATLAAANTHISVAGAYLTITLPLALRTPVTNAILSLSVVDTDGATKEFPSLGTWTVPPGKLLPGDENGDGLVDASELNTALRIYLGLIPLTTQELRIIDVEPLNADGTYGDGAVRADDINAVFRAFLGLADVG